MLATKNYIDFKIIQPGTGTILAEWSGASRANRALPEDTVCLTADGEIELVTRSARKPLVGVLCLTSKYMYGMTSHGVPIYLCEPLNKGYPGFRVACKERDRSQNLLVSFQFENWEAGSELPRGSLLKILGPADDPTAEAEALSILSCPWSAPRPESAPVFQASDRILLEEGTFNIDPPGCKDIDDVLTVQNLTDNTYRLWITIADVSEMVGIESKEYKTAEKIGATTYQGGAAVRPMLHKDLSEKACSLIPGERRYGLSLRIDWSPDRGFLSKPKFKKVMVTNQRSYTYENIYMADDTVLSVVAGIASDLAGRKITDSHEWIEQFMLFYNREAAILLKHAGYGLLRIHDEPFAEKRAALAAIDPKLEFLAYQSASYAPVSADQGHWGLSLETYCHASSPIRRFADLVNQQIIKDWLDERQKVYPENHFDLLADWLNRRQKQIAAAERDFTFLQAILGAKETTVNAKYLWAEKEKHVFYIEDWSTTIRIRDDEKSFKVGQNVRVSYFCDRRKSKWKERMIFKIIDS